MSYLYVASPYSHELAHVREARYLQVARYCGECAQRGEVVYSPIAHWHPIAKMMKLPKDWKYWERFDTALIANSRGVRVLMMSGWTDSVGIRAEVKIARAFDLPVEHIEVPQLVEV